MLLGGAHSIDDTAPGGLPIVTAVPNDDLLCIFKECVRSLIDPDVASSEMSQGVEVPDYLVSRYAAALASDTRTGILSNLWYHALNGLGPFRIEECARALLRRVAEGYDPTTIHESLLELLTSKKASAVFVASLEGFSCEAPIQVSEGISLVPPDLVPGSHATTVVFDLPRDSNSFTRRGHHFGPPLEAAFIVEHVGIEVIIPSLGEDQPFPRIQEFEETKRQMKVTLNAILLASGHAPAVRDQYVVFTDPGWPGERASGWSSDYTTRHYVQPSRGFNPNDLPRLHRLLSTSTMTSALDLAIEKLERSRRFLRLEDRVVELGTCLEMLMMHNESASNAEITNKISHRSAWLLGRTFEERKSIFFKTKALYADRSAAVHKGKLKKPETTQTDAYDRLCQALILELLERGSWPDPWTDLTLGGSASRAHSVHS